MCTMSGRLCKRSRRVDVVVEEAAVKKVRWRDFLNTGKRKSWGNSDSFEAAWMHNSHPYRNAISQNAIPSWRYFETTSYFLVRLVTSGYSDSKLNIYIMLVNL